MKKYSKSLTANSIFYLLYNVLNVFFPFMTGIYVTHVLSSETIGIVETAKNFVQYFVIMAFLGIPTYGLREISKYRKDKEKINTIYSELMTINFISTSVCLIAYLFAIFTIDKYNNDIKLYLIIGLLIFLNYFNNSWLYEGLEEFRYISLRNILFKTISFLLLIFCVKKSTDYTVYALITVIGTAGNYIINMINARKYVKFCFKNLNLSRHIKSIMYLVVVNLAIEIYSLVDITMLGWICESKRVAYYSYGIKIYKILLQIVNSFTMVLVPKISLYYKENKIDEFNSTINKTLKVILFITIPMIIGILFTSNEIICKIYGNEYINSSYVLKITSFILLVSSLGYLLGSRIMLVTGNEKKMIIPVVCGAICNIICNYFLINNYAEIGASIASLISEIVVMIIYIYFGKKYFKIINIKQALIKESYAIVCMTIWLYIASKIRCFNTIFIIFKILLAIIIYFGILIILKEEFICNFLNEKIIKKLKKKEDNIG